MIEMTEPPNIRNPLDCLSCINASDLYRDNIGHLTVYCKKYYNPEIDNKYGGDGWICDDFVEDKKE
jgi:hypothetical protein